MTDALELSPELLQHVTATQIEGGIILSAGLQDATNVSNHGVNITRYRSELPFPNAPAVTNDGGTKYTIAIKDGHSCMIRAQTTQVYPTPVSEYTITVENQPPCGGLLDDR